jgi:hypothetical protein
LSDLIVGAYGADVTGYKTNEGKSYVVFGKNNTNAVDLSCIAAGTGGFVIYGEGNGVIFISISITLKINCMCCGIFDFKITQMLLIYQA